MGKFVSALDLQKAQKARFAKMSGTAADLHRDMVRQVYLSGKKQLSGTPQGAARVAALKAAGHPYGRTRSRTGRKRGGAGFTQLPIGVISGRLRSSYRIQFIPVASRGGNTMMIGFFNPGRSVHVLTPGGTRKMVDRGFWQYQRKIWRPLNKALVDELRARQRKF
jgi:hypothetical protein